MDQNSKSPTKKNTPSKRRAAKQMPTDTPNKSPSNRRKPGTAVLKKKKKKSNGPTEPINFLKIVAVLGNIQVVIVDDQTPGQEGYNHPLHGPIREADPEVVGMGYFMTCCRRLSFHKDEKMKNSQDNWFRMVAIRTTEDEEDHEERLEFLRQTSRLMEESDRNKSGTKYIVDEATADQTPVEGMQRLDHYIRTRDVILFVQEQYENVDGHWAKNNPQDAELYFTGPNYPKAARERLGYKLLRN